MNDKSEEERQTNQSLSKFEGMLKANKVLFFDTTEFEQIVFHYLDAGKANLAKKALKLALEQHPNSVELRLVHVEILVFEKKLDQAEKIINQLIVIDPKNDEIYIQKASIFSKKGLHTEAIEQLSIALKYTDDLADVYNILGMEYLFIDNLEEAKIYFNLCIEADIEDQSSLYNLVYCYEFLDQNQAAIDYLNLYIDKNPYSEIAWHQIGRLQYSLKNYTEAIRAFEFATYIDEEFMGAYMEMAKAYEKLKKYDIAIENYTKTLYLDDATSFAFLRIGRCYEKLGKKQLALKFYNKTVLEDPLLDKGWIAITDFYIQKENFLKALYFVNKALSIDNKNSKYWIRFAKINLKINRLDEAEMGYQTAIEHGDMHLDTWLHWVDILQIKQQFEMAIGTLLLAADYFPEMAEIEYRLAGMYFTTQKNIKAKFHLKSALLIKFENKKILKQLYPSVWDMDIVQEIIKKHKKT